MKERIIQIAKGHVVNAESAFQILPGQLTGMIPENSRVRKELEIRTLHNKPVNGVAYSDCPNVRIKHNRFKGYRNHLYVEFDSIGWKAGEQVNGWITFVTETGEQKIPYTFQIQQVQSRENGTGVPQKSRKEWQGRTAEPQKVPDLQTDGEKSGNQKNSVFIAKDTAENCEVQIEQEGIKGKKITEADLQMETKRSELMQAKQGQVQFWKRLLEALVHQFADAEMEELEFQLLVCREECPGCMSELWLDLWQVFVLYHTRRIEEGMQLHASLASYFEEGCGQEESYLFWLYLQDRLLPEQMRGETLPRMEQFWRQQKRFLALLYLSEMDLNRLQHPDGMITECCGLYDRGVHSPLLLWKLCELLIANPMGFTIERSGMVEALQFGYRYGMGIAPLLEKAVRQLQEGKEVAHEGVLLRILQRVLQQEGADSQELWEQTILLMQKRNCIGACWFYWYHEAAQRHVKVEGLAELYLRSLPRTYRKAIAKSVVLYYAYGDALDADLQEALYTNVQIFYKEEETIYAGYRKRIEAFMVDHLMHRQINPHLQYLYSTVLQPELLDEHLARCMADVLSIEHVCMADPDGVKIRVRYPYLNRVWEYPLADGQGDVMIWNERAVLEVIASDGTCKESAGISRTVWIENAYLDEKCRSLQPDHLRYRLGWMIERMEQGVGTAEEAKQLIDVANGLELTEEAINRTVSVLVMFAARHPEESVCDGVLLGADAARLSVPERDSILQLLLQKGYEKAALEQIQRYGWQGLSTALLVQLMGWKLKRQDGNPEQWDVTMCAMLYQAGAREIWLLELLCRYWNHGQEEMMGLLQETAVHGEQIRPACRRMLAERLCIQSLFCGDWDKLPEAMACYQKEQGNSRLLHQAYLTARSYVSYMTGETDGILEEWFCHLPVVKPFAEPLPEICSIAYLQWYQKQEGHTEQADQFCLVLLGDLLGRKRYYGFYHGFANLAQMPGCLADQVILEYHSVPGETVTLYYQRDSLETEEQVVVMEEQFAGVYSARVSLFCGEQLRYRLCTRDGEQAVSLVIPDPFPSENQFARELNRAIRLYQQENWQEAKAAICRLEMKEYICKRLFAVQN